MTAGEIIANNYDYFYKRAKEHNNNDRQGTFEDVLHNEMYRTLKKYKDTEFDNDEEVMTYLKRTLFFESQFAPKRDRDIIFITLDEAGDI